MTRPSACPLHPESAPICHVIGAGVAGLTAACRLAAVGFQIHLYEAAPQAGGRCRSLPDQRFGTAIDNGSHILVSANRATLNFLHQIGSPSTALSSLNGLDFQEIKENLHWRITPSGESALWLLGQGLCIPGLSRWRLFRDGLSLMTSRNGTRTSTRLSPDDLSWKRLWAPFLRSVFNTDPGTVSAPHAANILKRLFFEGAASGRPLLAARPWSEIIAEPAIAHLRYQGASINFGMPLLTLERTANRVRQMVFRRGTIDTTDDAIILAVPNAAAHRLCPDIAPAIPHAPIINLHFETPETLGLGFCSLVGGIADAVFWRGSVVSVTIGHATALLDHPAEALAHTAWREAITALPLGISPSLPPWRRIIEKRATVAATPEAFAIRPGPTTPNANLFLAGDWTATGLPSTIEGAVLSGLQAAEATIAAINAG
ncbi:MAG: FAD-dependent oxidoreductase [Rhodospirillaceae bacterium]|nr:FAD-dependent oxidoreductase [Rhodospirillaceae bacterium]